MKNRVVFTALVGTCLVGCVNGGARSELSGAAGKIFDVDPAARSCRFLKQDVRHNRQTEDGQEWFRISWMSDARFTRIESVKDLAQYDSPIVAIFSGFDKRNKAALERGAPFRANRLELLPGERSPESLALAGDAVAGWFRAKPGEKSRDGVLAVGDEIFPAGIKSGGNRILVKRSVSVDALVEGFWKATLEGRGPPDNFVAESMQLERLTNPSEVDESGIPRVLSVGDSISMNYYGSTKQALSGVANYHRIEDNSWSTARGVAFMPYWLGDYKRPGLGWDVILFNSGLHDMKQTTPVGNFAVSLETYKMNLRKEIEMMKATGATLVWVSTTPVPNDCGSKRYGFRSEGAEKVFNEAALEVLKEFPAVQVLDLCEVVENSSVFDNWRKGRDVHFFTRPQQQVLGRAVASAVEEALTIRTSGPGAKGEAEKVQPKAIDQWEGMKGRFADRFDMYRNGRNLVVVPNQTAEGRPWVWRARFWRVEPQFDIAMLDKGYHVVYCDVGGLLGNAEAVARWNAFYNYLVGKHALAPKAILEGFSRGGLIVYNWASANPDKVAAIYGDAPVMDLKSWPKFGSRLLNRAYCFKTKPAFVAFDGNPVDNLRPLADAGIPIIHVVGDKDETVPVAENTALAEKRYLKMGGLLKVIHKTGVGHHPHSLADPVPIVRFMERYVE